MQFSQKTLVEVFQHGRWAPAAELRAVDVDRCRFEYLPEYIFGDHANPPPIAHGLPVGFAPQPKRKTGAGSVDDLTPPAFVYDLIPQGRGRRFLVERLNVADTDAVVLPLVMAGAFSPIGNLRLSSAVAFYEAEVQRAGGKDAAVLRGFGREDIVLRSAEYLDHIGVYAMLAAGTTGVQGVAPKFLLATDAEGQWFADLALDDSLVRAHWLLKLPRGRSDDDRAVLRNEAPYLRVAAACGLRAQAEPVLEGEMLFLRRFDRVVAADGLHRLPQESLASVIGMTGMTKGVSQNRLLAGLGAVVADPLAETIEFCKRDVLNLAMRNTDNHARNSAVQTTLGGLVQLTPLYDFAPMFKDPEVVPRTCHWEDADGVRQNTWRAVLETLAIPDSERAQLAKALYDFADTVGRLPTLAQDLGVEPEILSQCLKSMEVQAEQLRALRPLVG